MKEELNKKRSYHAGAPGRFSVLPGEIEDKQKALVREGKDPKKAAALANDYKKRIETAELPESEPKVYHLTSRRRPPPHEGAEA